MRDIHDDDAVRNERASKQILQKEGALAYKVLAEFLFEHGDAFMSPSKLVHEVANLVELGKRQNDSIDKQVKEVFEQLAFIFLWLCREVHHFGQIVYKLWNQEAVQKRCRSDYNKFFQH